jgi:hypothetical protein
VGTQKENVHDMLAKGRDNYQAILGESNGKSKLTDQQVREIRKLYVPGKITYAKVGELYGITGDAVRYVVTRGWKHVK